MKKTLFSCLLLLHFTFSAIAQEGRSGFDFLRFPTSAHAGALGGTNVSIIENDLSLIYHNPGFLGQEMDKSLNFNYLMYIADIGMGSVTFAKSLGEKSSWGVGFNYINYGEIKETPPLNNEISGDLSTRDICGNLFFSRDLTEKIRGGVAAKFVYSAYDQYTSIGLGVDLGLSYYDKDRKFSAGLVGKNLGRQVKAYYEETEEMPWDIQLGITKGLSHAPIRISVTGVQLNRWDFYDVNGKKDAFFRSLSKHLIIGMDFIPSDNLWVGLGYNVKTGADLSLLQGNKMGGFSIGAGLKIKAFQISCSAARYHPSATSFMTSLSMTLGQTEL